MKGGYADRILNIDLSAGKISVKNLDPFLAMNYLGGKGLGAKLLYDNLSPGVDPLSPENLFIVATGPLTGTYAPSMSAKYAIITKSPETHIFLDTYIGGFFGAELKLAGYDAIIIKGRSSKPVYLRIQDDDVELKDASYLWGKGCYDTEIALREKEGEYFRVLTIGPAGEKQVKFACITGDFGRNAGRGGAGAILGSKNIKALIVNGNKSIKIAEFDKFFKLCDDAREILKNDVGAEGYSKYGTVVGNTIHSFQGLMPTRNFQTGVFDKVEGLDANLMLKKIVVAHKSCFGCPVYCWSYTHIKNGPYKDTYLVGPEYETSALLGSNCGIGDIEVVAKANQLCDQLGIDTISTGNVVAFAMECYEKGILTKKDTNGIDLKFGNHEALLNMIEKIGRREGLGDLLAEGVKAASEKIKKGSESFAMHTKGLEMPGQVPHAILGMTLAFATSDIGASHLKAWTVAEESGAIDEIGWEAGPLDRRKPDGKAEFVIFQQNEKAAIDSLVACEFMCWIRGSAFFGLEYPIKILNAATGFNFDKEKVVLIGERIYNLTRMFNVREGVTKKDDYILPERIYKDSIPEGPAKGLHVKKEDLERMMMEYYEIRRWDKETGIPLKETLRKLELD